MSAGTQPDVEDRPPSAPRRRRRGPTAVVVVLVLLVAVALAAWWLARDGSTPGGQDGAGQGAAAPDEAAPDGAGQDDAGQDDASQDGAGTLRPEDFGAVGDGSADDTAALQDSLDALEPGQRLVLADGGVYAASDVLVLSVPDVEVVGDAELRATDEERSSFQVEADDVVISGVTFTTPSTTQRWSAEEQQRLVLRGTDGAELHDVTVRGSAAAGVFVSGGSTNFLLDGVHVEGTRADGIHITQGSSDGRLVDVSTQDTGDDGVAVVSYAQDGAPSARIEVDSPVVRGSDARGISVVGGEHVTWTDVDVSGTAAAGIYVATEGDPYFTTDTRDVVVDGGQVREANTDEGIDHGAVLLYDGSDDSVLADVVVRDVDVSGTRGSASRQVGVIGEQAVEGAELDGISVEGGPEVLLSAPAAQDLRVEGWTDDGEPVEPLAVG